jgi:hypothetical protein
MNRTQILKLAVKELFIGMILTFLSVGLSSAQTRTVRIVTYNIEADINGATTALPGLITPWTNANAIAVGGSLEGIGEESVGRDPARPLDILALEETTANPITVSPICNGLNTFYNSPGMYTNSTYQATEEEGDIADGNGPNAVIYNTRTLQLLASRPVDPPGGAANLGPQYGEYREAMRYEFAPAGVAATSSNDFYVYVSHYKSGTSTADANDRAGEAAVIRTNEAIDLPATARVIYVGDYNVDTSGEAGYQTILALKSPNGIQQGQGVDPLNATNNPNIDWETSTTNTAILLMLTEHSYDLEYRDDLQLMTANIYYGTPSGFAFIPGTYHAFGNNGTTPYNGSVATGPDTALNNDLVTNGPVFISAYSLYQDLANASDHLPVVVDYSVPIPAPVFADVAASGNNLTFSVADGITGAVYTVCTATNLTLMRSNWVPVTTNICPAGNFTLTITNDSSSGFPAGFYLLRTQ